MDLILDYYRDAIRAERQGVPFIDKANDLFGFNGSSIPVDRNEKLFQRYQNDFGKSNNIIKAFDDWLENQLPTQLKHVIFDPDQGSNSEYHFENLRIYKPYMTGRGTFGVPPEGLPPINDIVPMYPRDAMTYKKTYASLIIVDIVSKQKDSDGEYSTNIVSKDSYLGYLPIIKGCKYCWLNGMSDDEKIKYDECFNDPLGYFIIDGAEKTIIASDKLRYGKMIIYKDDKGSKYKSIVLTSYTVNNTITFMTSVDSKNDNNIVSTFYSKNYTMPSLCLSLLLHFLGDRDLTASVRSYQDIISTSKSVLQNVIIPEILEFTGEEDLFAVKYRLTSSITKAMGIIEKRTFEYIQNVNRGNEEKYIDFIEVLCQTIDVKKTDASKKGPAKLDSSNIREKIRMNVFPDFAGEKSSTIDDFSRRRKNLSKMLSVYTRYLAGKRESDDIDSYLFKRIDTTAASMKSKFGRTFDENVSKLKTNAFKLDSTFSKEFNRHLRSGTDSGKKNDKQVTDQLKRDTPASVYSQIQRIASNTGDKSKLKSPRFIHPTQIGYVCSGETPEGQNCGVLKNLTTLCWISIPRNVDDVGDIVSEYVGSVKNPGDDIIVTLNGVYLGWFNSKNYLKLKEEIKTRDDMFDVCVDYNYLDRMIEITTTGYIPTRPMYKVNPATGRLWVSDLSDVEFDSLTVLEMNARGYLEFNSPGEVNSIFWGRSEDSDRPWSEINKGINYIKIAEYVEDVAELREAHANGERLKEQPYTHAEIIPHVQFGYSATCVPKANLNKGPRVTYQCSMFKQALSGYHSMHTGRFESGFKLHQFPTRTVFETSTHYPIGLNAMPTTTSPIVAIMVTPKNNEDALTAKREYLDNNLRYTYYSTNVISIKNKEVIDILPSDEGKPTNHALYKRSDGVDEALIGFPKIGAYINKGDAILGKYYKTSDTSTGEIIYKPTFTTIGLGKDGFVAAVEITQEQSIKTIKIKIGQHRREIVGDKVASRYSQKGTFGEIKSENELPRIVGGPNDGVVPDFFFNAHSIPSRLTQGKILELLIGKDCVYTGKRVNASPYGEYMNDDYMGVFEASLEARGLDPTGVETLRFPDGTLVESKIYVGVCAYQALKHNVADKIQARNTGKNMPLTHQPIKGKSNEGGGKIGGMERDAIISHGIADCVLDRMMNSSDLFKVVVCKKCGNLAVSNFDPKKTHCQYCPDSKSFGVVTIPYTSLLVNRLLNGAGIHMHYKF